ncbi:MAG: hypothetical protein KDB37_08100 [Ilumatobacter sp.]|nr:hypothetical protein [Ilumatobacter sp.]
MNRMHRLVTVGAVAIVTLAGCSSSAEETFIPVDDAGSTGSTADGAGEVPSTAQLVASYGSGRAEAAAPTPRGTVVVTTIGGTILDEGGERPLDTDWTTGQFRSASLSTDEDVIGIARDSPATMEWYDIESGALLGAHQLESTDVVVQTIAAGTGSPPIALTSGGVVRFAPSTGVTEFVPYPSGTTIAGTAAVVASGLVIVPLAGTGSVWIVSTDEEAVRDLGLGDGVQVADVHAAREGEAVAVTVWTGADQFERRDSIVSLDPTDLTVIGSVEFDRPLDPTAWTVTTDAVAVADGSALHWFDAGGADTTPTATSPIALVDAVADAVVTVGSDGAVTVWQDAEPVTTTDGGSRIITSTPGAGGLGLVDHYGVITVLDADGEVAAVDERFAPGEFTSAAVSSAGDRIAVAGTNGAATILDADLRPTVGWSVPEAPTRIDTVRFAPNDSLFTGLAQRTGAQAFDDTVAAWPDGPDGPAFEIGGDAEDVAGCAFYYNRIEFSADGSWFATTSHDFSIEVVDTVSGARRALIPPLPSAILDIALTDDDQHIVVSTDDARVSIWSIDPVAEVASAETSMGGYQALAARRGTNEIVALDLLGNLTLISADDGTQLRTLDGTAARSTTLEVSPDGALAAAPLDDGSIGVWSLDDGRLAMTVPGHVGGIGGLAFGPDARRLVSVSDDGTMHLWQLG